MDKSAIFAKVYIAEEGFSVECVCPIRDIESGDEVQIILNNKPILGIVTEIRDVELEDLPSDVYNMKQIIKRTKAYQSQTEKIKEDSFALKALFERNQYITVVSHGVVGRFLFDMANIQAMHAEKGDYVYLCTSGSDRFRCAIIAIENSSDASDHICHIEAVEKDEHLAEILQWNISIKDKDKAVILNKCKTREESFCIDAGITGIAAKAFTETPNLKLLTVSARMYIDPLAFSGNDSLEEIRIVNNMINISINSFDGCKNLKRLLLPYSCYHMKEELEAFYKGRVHIEFALTDMDEIVDGIVYAFERRTLVCCLDKRIKEFTASLTLENIYPYAFKDCIKLKTFILTPFVKNVGNAVLSGCSALAHVECLLKRKVDVLDLFGTEQNKKMDPMQVELTDGSKVIIYLPRKTKFCATGTIEDALKDITPDSLSPELCFVVGNYYSSIHRPEKSIQFHQKAVLAG